MTSVIATPLVSIITSDPSLFVNVYVPSALSVMSALATVIVAPASFVKVTFPSVSSEIVVTVSAIVKAVASSAL